MSLKMRHFIMIGLMALGLTANAVAAEDLYKQLPGDIVLGKESAPITIIEYASLSCPHCAHFHANVIPGVKEKYIEAGKAKFIFRAFPLDLPALKGAALAYCAGEDKFYPFLKVLFETQESWAFQKNYLEMLANIGKLGGVKSEQFESCMNDKELEDRILQIKLDGAKNLEIKATPTIFINGEVYKGEHTAEAFIQVLDAIKTEPKKAEPAVAPKVAPEEAPATTDEAVKPAE